MQNAVSVQPVQDQTRAAPPGGRAGPTVSLRPARPIGNQAVLRRRAALEIAPAEGPMETEADRLADHMAGPAPLSGRSAPRIGGGAAPARPLVQRRCTACESKARESEGREEPASLVEPVLSSPGRGLDLSARRAFEQRLGADLSGVRIHTDGEAERSARALGALAYTVGPHIAFAPGQYRPDTARGRHLLAHEIAHTVQQGAGGPVIQRWADCKPARLSLVDCPPREPGEIRRAASTPMAFRALDDVIDDNHGALVVNFDIGKSTIKPNLKHDLAWNQFLDHIAANKSKWELIGFSDCQGSDSLDTVPKGHAPPADLTVLNEPLRRQRAEAIYKILPEAIKPQITLREGAAIQECITSNDSANDRALNRSVALRFAGFTADFKKPEPVQATAHKFICGPDVTETLVRTLGSLRAIFGSWDDCQRKDACGALMSVRTGGHAWDLMQLHWSDWISDHFNPPCATPGANPQCDASVQVQDDCHYAGSVNYVAFGTMCRLCLDHLRARNDSDADNFELDRMQGLIWLYKGPNPAQNILQRNLLHPFGEAANYDPSQNWAAAGHRGWPNAATPPADRSNCTPICPRPISYRVFDINWVPILGKEGRR